MHQRTTPAVPQSRDMPLKLRLFCRPDHLPLTTKKRENQAYYNADDDAGDDREIECGMFTLDPNIARQTPEPSCTEPAPKCEAEKQS